MTTVRFCAVFLFAAFLTSCASRPVEVLLNTEKTPPDYLLERVREQGGRVQSLAGHGVVSFDTPEISGSASFDVTMKKPDSLLVVLEGPLGFDVGTLFLSRGKFVLYNSLENVVMTGDPTNSRIRSLIPVGLSYSQILDAFAGLVALPAPEMDVSEYAIVDDQFVLVSTCGTNLCKFWIDPRYLLVTKYEVRNAHAALILKADLSSFTADDSVAVPKRIRLTLPQQNREITIAYNSVHLNPNETDFTFKVPSNARKVTADSLSDGMARPPFPRR